MADDDKKKFDLGLLKRVFQYVRPYRNKFYLSIFLAILLAVLAPIRPMLIQKTIQGIGNEPEHSWFSGPYGFIIQITVIQVALLIIETLARFVFTFGTASLGQSVVKDLRVNTFSKIIHLNLRQFDTTPIGTLTTRTVNDIESINDIFSDGLIPILADLMSIISILVYMFSADVKLTLICLAPFPLLIFGTYIFKESVNRSFIKVRNAVSALNAFVQEHLTGMTVVQTFAAEKEELNKFKAINTEHRNANVKAIFAYSVFFPFVELISALSLGLLVWWAAKEWYGETAEGARELSGLVTSFILCVNLLFRPLRMLADKFNVLQMGLIASERVFKVLDNEDVTAGGGNVKDVALQGAIAFENVHFSYVPDVPVLRGVSFDIGAGETLAIVGSTGSGKTSIVSLLNRMYEIGSGSIKIDGRDIREYDTEFLRSRIAVVLQDVFLFTGSVLDNVTLRNEDVPQESVEAAAKMIGMDEFINRLPGAYHYNVMERGATLSQGQRQLLSFIRAILFDPAILILDEATSSVDNESELLIQNAIDKLIAGRTSIVIAHRLSTIRKADKILVLRKGEVVEFGSHEELLARQGEYFELYRHQFATA